MPLGSTHQYAPAAMVNLLGEEGHTGPAHYEGMATLLATSEVFPFLYGKAITKPYRKMGHVTIMDESMERLKEKVELVKSSVKVVSL